MAVKLTKLVNILTRTKVYPCVFNRYKQTIDHSKVPTLKQEDLEEEFVRGNGPGGQAVNKTSNAVVLRHKPTGLVVKCHQTRSLARNRELAQQLMVNKLDEFINGDMSVAAQRRRIADEKNRRNANRSEKLNQLKEQWKQREGID